MYLESIPDTTGYMIAGYTVTFLVIGVYILSLYMRRGNLKRDAETLESIKTDSKPKIKPKPTKKK